MKLYPNPKSAWSIINIILWILFALLNFVECDGQPVSEKGLKLNGENYVDCGNPPGNLYDFTNTGTIEAWVKVTALPPPANSTTFYPIVAKDEGSGEKNKWIFGLQEGRLVFHVNSRSGAFNVVSNFFTLYSQPFNFVLNKYYHFAITKDKDNIVTFYVNGANAGSCLLMRKTEVINAPLLIARAEPGFSFYGQIYEIRFWSKALNENEIKAWMLREPDASHPEYRSLKLSFRFDHLNGKTVKGQNGAVATLVTISPSLWNIPYLPSWVIILSSAGLVVLILVVLLYVLRKKMHQEKLEMELFAAQMSHENNNGIGMMINTLSSQLESKGLGYLDTQLKHRLQTIADLQSAEYIIPDNKSLAFKKYVTRLVEQMNSVFSDGKQIVFDMDLPEKIKAKHAMKLALLIRELTLNSLKHAFPGRSGGKIHISIRREGKNLLRFEFSDNGHGIAEDKKGFSSVGTAIISSVSSQLGGKPVIISSKGYKFILLFKP